MPTQKKVFISFIVMTAIILLVFVAVLPYRFYQRDVRQARDDAKRISHLIKEGLLSTMTQTDDVKAIRKLIADYQTHYDFTFRLIRSEFVEKQHGVKEDHQGKDELIREVLKLGKGREDWPASARYRYVMPFVAEERCRECHKGLDDGKIQVGAVLGASEIVFDLAPVKKASIRFIVEVLLLLAASLLGLGFTLYTIARQGLQEKRD